MCEWHKSMDRVNELDKELSDTTSDEVRGADEIAFEAIALAKRLAYLACNCE